MRRKTWANVSLSAYSLKGAETRRWAADVELAGLLVAVLALGVALATAQRQIRQARHANVVPVLIDLFREHRSTRFTNARRFVYRDLQNYDLTNGMDSLPEDDREVVRDLMSYYDNLGAMVAHQVIDIEPVAG